MPNWSDEQFFTVAEVADRLRLNQQTIRNWIEADRLPALRLGRRVRILRSDFDQLIASAAQTPVPDSAHTTPAQDFCDGAWMPPLDDSERTR